MTLSTLEKAESQYEEGGVMLHALTQTDLFARIVEKVTNYTAHNIGFNFFFLIPAVIEIFKLYHKLYIE